MTEAQALYLLMLCAFLAAGLIVWHYGKPEAAQAQVAAQPRRYAIHTDTGALFLETDDYAEACKARAWTNGRITEQ